MKTPLAVALALSLVISVALADDSSATVNLSRKQAELPVGIEPAGGVFLPVLKAGETSGSCTIKARRLALSNGTVAIYAIRSGMRDDLPLARLLLAEKAEETKITVTRQNGKLIVAAADAKDAKRAIAVNELSKTASRATALVQPKATNSQPAAIAAAEGHELRETLGLRSTSGTFRPFLWAGAPTGSPTTVKLTPATPGQTSADVTVYAGNHQYLEDNKPYARYLITGLSENPKAQFALHFAVDQKGKVGMPEVTDSITGKPLTVKKYSSSEGFRIQNETAGN